MLFSITWIWELSSEHSINTILLLVQKQGKVPPVHKFKPEPDIDKDGKITDVLTAGQTVIVQITKEPISTKGPRLASEISLAGRNLVLMPYSDKVSISSKIESNEEKNRLKTLVQSIKPRNYGVIVRTVAEGKKVAVLDAELRDLVQKWESCFSGNQKGDQIAKIVYWRNEQDINHPEGYAECYL